MATHRAMALKTFDEIIFMEHGKIIERGTFDELMALNGRKNILHRITICSCNLIAAVRLNVLPVNRNLGVMPTFTGSRWTRRCLSVSRNLYYEDELLEEKAKAQHNPHTQEKN